MPALMPEKSVRSLTSPAAVDAIRVSPGYEIALGAALTDDLEAGLDETAPVRWTIVAGEGDSALPEGAVALSAFVDGPQELARRLAQIGVVDRTSGARLQRALTPGQRLVSREGDVWRWRFDEVELTL